jgi:hypothetical protein
LAVGVVVISFVVLGILLYVYRRRWRESMKRPRPRIDTYTFTGTPEMEAAEVSRNAPKAFAVRQPDVLETGSSSSPAAENYVSLLPQTAVAAGMMAYSPPQDAAELAASVPEELPTGSIADVGPEETEEEIQQRLDQIQEERESLTRIVALRRLESLLGSRLSTRTQRNGSGGPLTDI